MVYIQLYYEKFTYIYIIFFSINIYAQDEFEKYPAPLVTDFKKNNLVVSKENRSIKTILINAYKQPVNFSGKYIIFTYACGGGCLYGGVIDTKSGKVVSQLPAMYDTSDSAESEFEIVYKKSSRLLIIRGRRIDKDSFEVGAFSTDFYEFKNNNFYLIKSE